MHTLKYVNSGTWEYPATINEDGDIEVSWAEQEILDVDETSVWCEECGRPVYSGDGIHNINDDWQAL